MQAGKQRGALPLIRRFNQHSERLLNSALCVRIYYLDTEFSFLLAAICLPRSVAELMMAPKILQYAAIFVLRIVLMTVQRYDAIDLDDLRDPHVSSVIALEMKDRQRYFEGRVADDAAPKADGVCCLCVSTKSLFSFSCQLDMKEVLETAKSNFQDWKRNLASVSLIVLPTPPDISDTLVRLS